MIPSDDYYHILHVHPQANREVIKASYRTLMQKLKHHPDLGGDEAEAARINKAYTVLHNPRQRAAYDKLVALGLEPFSGAKANSTKPVVAAKEKSAQPNAQTNTSAAVEIKAKNGRAQLVASAYGSAAHTRRTDIKISQRDSVRKLTSLGIRIELVDSNNKKHSAKIKNISATGLYLWLPALLRVGETVRLDNADLKAVAEVVRCKNAALGYHYGLKFVSVERRQVIGGFVSASA